MAFDINQPHAIIVGDGTSAHYQQDGKYYDRNGVELPQAPAFDPLRDTMLARHADEHRRMGNVVEYTKTLTGGSVIHDSSGAVLAFPVTPTTEDMTDVVDAIAQSISVSGGGVLQFAPGVFNLRYMKLYPGVIYAGAGIGKHQGDDGTTLRLKTGTNPTDGFINRAENKTTGWVLRDLVVDGNKAGNTSGSGIYLFHANDGINITGENDEYALIEDVIVRDCAGSGLFIDGDGSIGGKYYNVRSLRLNRVYFRTNEGSGIEANKLTDSYMHEVTCSGNKGGALRAVSCANLDIARSKGYYNGSSLTSSDASFTFSACKRSHIDIEAQEEYTNGVMLYQCSGMRGRIFADANGFPNTSAVAGAWLKDVNYSSLEIIADSFHAPDTVPFLQDRGIRLESTAAPTRLHLTVIHANQNTGIQYALTGTPSGLVICENGTTAMYGDGTSYPLRIGRTPNAYDNFQMTYFVGGSNESILDFDLMGQAGTQRNFRYGRYTNTSGGVSHTFFKGDNSSAVAHRLNCQGYGHLEIQPSGGGLWNTGHLVMGAFHLWVDAAGRLRVKSGQPTSDIDGTIVGAQA